jgi:hypothetical protein
MIQTRSKHVPIGSYTSRDLKWVRISLSVIRYKDK